MSLNASGSSEQTKKREEGRRYYDPVTEAARNFALAQLMSLFGVPVGSAIPTQAPSPPTPTYITTPPVNYEPSDTRVMGADR